MSTSDGQQEHRAPPEALQQYPANQRADRTTSREAGNPHGDGDRTLPRIQEHVADQRQGGRGQGRPRERYSSRTTTASSAGRLHFPEAPKAIGPGRVRLNDGSPVLNAPAVRNPQP